MLTKRWLLVSVVLACFGKQAADSPANHQATLRYPATEKRIVTDTYFGTRVSDEYRWLENGKDPSVLAWTQAQNALARARLDPLPDRRKIRARVDALLSHAPPGYWVIGVRGNLVFALKEEPPKEQPLIVVFTDVADAKSERLLLDPMAVDPSGKTSIDFVVPSRDGKRFAVSLSRAGTERGDVHIYETADGKALPDVVAHVNGGTAGGDIAWNAAGTGFWYTRYPRDGERPKEDLDFFQQVWFHEIGASSDTYVFGKELPRIAEISFQPSDNHESVLATVANGDGGEFAIWLLEKEIVQIARFEDKLLRARFGPDGAIYMLSLKTTPRGSIVRLRRPFTTSKPELVVPESEGVLQQLVVTRSHAWVVELAGGPSRLLKYDLRGGTPEVIDVPVKVPSILNLKRFGDDDLLYAVRGYTSAPAYFRWDAKLKKSLPTALESAMPFNMEDVEVVRETCTSKDGTHVPMSIVRLKGTRLDGTNPTLLTGYGGYGASQVPRFLPLVRLWLDQGGVFAEANLRGGGEFGDAWHEAGKLTNKQNVFDDFYACIQKLIEVKYTSPAHLGIMGGSNGGLLMGATLVQHPESFRAVVSYVGIYDMLRVETTPNGAFNVTEFGTVKDEKQFRALLAYSPLQNARDGTAYPSVLFLTGANDPRVDPYHSRKMIARLQAASSSMHPLLLRASNDAGHGRGTPLAEEIEEQTDVYAFLMHELGMAFR